MDQTSPSTLIRTLRTQLKLSEEQLASRPWVSVATVNRREAGKSKNSVLGNSPMEQMLWDAACSIRGEKNAPKFKDYLLPLLFAKRLSDVFDDEVRRVTDRVAYPETALTALESDHGLIRFYLPYDDSLTRCRIRLCLGPLNSGSRLWR